MLTEDMDFAIFNELDSSGANWQPNGNFIETNPLQLEDNFQSSGSFSTPELEEIIATNGTKEMEFQWQFPESDLTGNFNSNSAYQWNHGDPLTGNFNSAYQWNHGDPFTGNKAIDSDSTDSTKRDVFTDSEAVLEASVFEARNQLEIFANGEDFFNELNQAFELDVSSTEAKAVIEDLASGETMPKIEILSANELNNANAAFGEETIYVSEEFLSDNSDSLDVVEGVLLEEMGHYVDRELNLFDSPGDEGDIFSQLVRGDTISGAELDDLQAEDDSATISVDGEVISVELAEPSSLEPTPGTDYTELVPIPPDSEINQGLTSPLPEVMYDLIGDPGNAETGEVSPELEELLVTRNVGPFEVSGLTPAVDALERIFTQVKEDNPELYEQLGYSGMYNLRRINSVDTGPIPGTISNHSWGTAIDINIGDDPDFETDGKTDRGLVELAPYFEKEGFYWGAGFDTNEDPMHFEASKELLERWRDEETAVEPASPSEDEYLVGDWNGDGTDNIAVRRGGQILMDINGDGSLVEEKLYGNGNAEDEYLVGDWNNNNTDNIAVRRGGQILMDINGDGSLVKEQLYGNGTSQSPPEPPPGTEPIPIPIPLPMPYDATEIINSPAVEDGIRASAETSVPLILSEAQESEVTDPGQIAYILATADHESGLGENMEEFASGEDYEGKIDLGNTQPGDGPLFKGRGYVQITGRNNYTDWSEKLGVDLVGNPELATVPDNAARILVEGMRDGNFTGKTLSEYINGENRDFYNARQIVNGIDPAIAQDIADDAERYYEVLTT